MERARGARESVLHHDVITTRIANSNLASSPVPLFPT